MKNDPGLLERIRGPLRRRLDGCIQVEGQHFEHLLLHSLGNYLVYFLYEIMQKADIST